MNAKELVYQDSVRALEVRDEERRKPTSIPDKSNTDQPSGKRNDICHHEHAHEHPVLVARSAGRACSQR